VPPFPKPSFDYRYRLESQVAALRRYRDTKPGRSIPARRPGRLLVASWNIANLGLHERREADYELIAELVSWFDLVAVQEVHDNLVGLRAVRERLPESFRALFSDAAGNNERLAYLYDSSRVTPLEKVGEIAIPPSDVGNIRLPGIEQAFLGFDRNPYLAAFRSGSLTFLLVNVHVYFGSDHSKIDMGRRTLETFAIARWADLRRASANTYTPNIFPLGDFNLPRAEPGDPVYDALTRRGLRLPPHSTEIGSSIARDKHYDQIAFFPGPNGEQAFEQVGVFDFDGAVFASLWRTRSRADFLAYLRYHLSDHRILWAEVRV
jgi:endonuclease/exonuclease/phosphatase family metal-dependent hydrolase